MLIDNASKMLALIVLTNLATAIDTDKNSDMALAQSTENSIWTVPKFQVKTAHKRKDDLPPEMSNIKLNLWNDDSTLSREDIYAKVTSVQLEEKRFYIRFTSHSPAVEAKLKEIYQSIESAQQ